MTDVRHVQVDIETLGIKPGSVVASIGAVCFDPFAGVQTAKDLKKHSFKITIDIRDAIDRGLEVDGDTILWWMTQTEEARQATFFDKSTRVTTAEAIQKFSEWYRSMEQEKHNFVWGNGPNFDMVLLECVCDKLLVKYPWKFNKIRCFRTFKSTNRYNADLVPANALTHDCLADAVHQAQIMQAICLENPNIVFK